ncbi:replication initiator protein A [Burkholderia multivorans]|uniref:replication initiator protein A n=1 Tax=Burkholderia multivorans TaxID=87883 RepID=UPI0021C24F94|nr:replication initiator protein A [Burkholderia multivorans]
MSTVEQERSYSLRGSGPGNSQLPGEKLPDISSIVVLRDGPAAEAAPPHDLEFDAEPLDDAEQLELFEGEQLAATWKPREDLHSLEFPLFSLQKGKDTRYRVYKNGEQIVRIIPSAVGAANIFDKDLLVYAATLICKAADAGQPVSRRIRFKVRDFLNYTNRSTGGSRVSAHRRQLPATAGYHHRDEFRFRQAWRQRERYPPDARWIWSDR